MSDFFFHSSTGPIHRLYHLPARPPVTITPSVIPIPCMYVCMSVCFLVLLLNHPTGLCQCSPQKSLILPPQILCLPYDRAHHPSPITHHPSLIHINPDSQYATITQYLHPTSASLSPYPCMCCTYCFYLYDVYVSMSLRVYLCCDVTQK